MLISLNQHNLRTTKIVCRFLNQHVPMHEHLWAQMLSLLSEIMASWLDNSALWCKCSGSQDAAVHTTLIFIRLDSLLMDKALINPQKVDEIKKSKCCKSKLLSTRAELKKKMSPKALKCPSTLLFRPITFKRKEPCRCWRSPEELSCCCRRLIWLRVIVKGRSESQESPSKGWEKGGKMSLEAMEGVKEFISSFS